MWRDFCYAQVVKDEPKEYSDGWTQFLGCKIDLSKRPLIPRPETEFWVEKAVACIKGQASGLTRGLALGPSVLDLFTGSGCIGIAVATQCPTAEVTLADIKNLISTPLPKNSKFVQSDLFSKLAGKFDFILANPPYVPTVGPTSRDALRGASIMDHEPKEALYAGKDGLDVIKKFLEQAPSHLNKGGQIWMEFGSEQKEEITNLLREFNYYQGFACTFHRDQHDRWRYLVATN